MTTFDLLFAAVLALAWPAWTMREYRTYLTRVRSRMPGARLAAYAQGVITQWLLASVVVALWIHLARAWTDLGLVMPAGWQAWAALGLAAVLGGLLLGQSAAVARRPDTHEQVRAGIAAYAEILPVSRSDLSGFSALSITAGICEELLFRGYLPWCLTHWFGAWGAQAIALVVFALAHLYLGWGAVVRALIAGGVAAGLFLWSGSLLPSMVFHALLDLSGGWLGYIVLGEDSGRKSAGGSVTPGAAGEPL
jgi:membrane protease YdiL (CAAX protease family)